MNSLYLFICVHVLFGRPSNWNSLCVMKIWDARSLLHDVIPSHRCAPRIKCTIKVRNPWWRFKRPNTSHQPKSINSLLSLPIDHFSFETQSISLDSRSQSSPGQDLPRALNPLDSNSSHYRKDIREWAYCFNHLAIHLSILYLFPDSLYLTLMAWEHKLFYNEGFPTAYSPHYAHKHTHTHR